MKTRRKRTFRDKFGRLTVPFIIQVDSNEAMHKQEYQFLNIRSDSYNKNELYYINTQVESLFVGDYGIVGMPQICVERKTKNDLFMTLSNEFKTKEMTDRIAIMNDTLECSSIIVECERSEIHSNPSSYSRLHVKTVIRKILSWSIDFPCVQWHFCPNRDYAEKLTFQTFNTYYRHVNADEIRNRSKLRQSCYRSGFQAKMAGLGREFAVEDGSLSHIDWLVGWDDAENMMKQGFKI